jgi:hypothetical protein
VRIGPASTPTDAYDRFWCKLPFPGGKKQHEIP